MTRWVSLRFCAALAIGTLTASAWTRWYVVNLGWHAEDDKRPLPQRYRHSH
jgi:hypothetical protein